MLKEYSIKEIADIIEVSKTTVRKAIQRLDLSYDTIKNNKQLYSEVKTKKIIKDIKPDFEFANSVFKFANSDFDGENPQPKVETSQTEAGNSKTESGNSQTENTELLKMTIELLAKQLEEKDRQINSLNDRLKEAMALTQGQQFLTATDKQAQILEAQTEGTKDKAIVIEEEQKENKSLFTKWFKK